MKLPLRVLRVAAAKHLARLAKYFRQEAKGILALLGLCMVGYGCLLIWPPAAYIVVGLMLLAVVWLGNPKRRERK